MSFGEKLDKFITDKGFQKSWLADQVGISKQQLNKIIKTNAVPRNIREIEQKLIEIFGAEAASLVTTNSLEIEVLSSENLKPTGHKILADNIALTAILINESPFPDEIPKNSLLVIDKDKTITDGKFIVIKTSSDSILLRKIYFNTEPTSVTLQSEIGSETCDINQLEILGVVSEVRLAF